jgi:putative aldouronate transport system permease protein
MNTKKTWFKRRNPNQLLPAANTVINIIFILFASVCILPVILVFMVSISSETSIMLHGFSLFPQEFSFRAYDIIFREQSTVLRAYGVTLFVTITGMIFCVVTVCLYAYPLSRPTFKFRKFFIFFLFITMLFSGGLVASYMVNVNILQLRDNIWIMILPMSFNAFWVIVMRTFYKTQIPESLIESAKIDGAGEWYALIKVVLPLSLPGIATVALFSTIGIWNDFFLNLLYIRNQELYNLQRMIQETLGAITMLREMMFKLGSAGITVDMRDMPSQTFRMAMCIVTIGPIVLAYPFFQKYFIRGLTIGAIKE